MNEKISIDTIVGEALELKQENQRLWNRIAKLETDKRVLVMALEKIARWENVDSFNMAKDASKALEAIKEGKS